MNQRKSIRALKVRQWLDDWNDIRWSRDDRRTEPLHWFYQFSIPASQLRALSGIYPRTTQRTRATQDLGIQRRHEKERSTQIRNFVKYGYPWSELSEAKRQSGEFKDLRQPGWLPTAIVVNILTDADTRLGRSVHKDDLICISDLDDEQATVALPANFPGGNWVHTNIPPIEVIDGQHRLWAFDDKELSGQFELPVVAFLGLDISWQAYLFYTINIKPKKINASLAFDLYPLLRTEEWLTKFEGHVIYRETRAQELVDILWSHPKSPWHHRINMLGEKGYKGRMVTQAAWIRSLLSSLIKSWEGARVNVGGLFGTPVGSNEMALPWSRLEQAAFLIVWGCAIRDAIASTNLPWTTALREESDEQLFEQDQDPAFYGQHCLLNQDQGLRIFLQVLNDLMFVRVDALKLYDWGGSPSNDGSDEDLVSDSLKQLKNKSKIMQFVKKTADLLAAYDWRASSGPGLTESERTLKASFRGSGGYKELRRHVLRHVAKSKSDPGTAAGEVIELLGY